MSNSRRKGGGFDHNSYVNADGEIESENFEDDGPSRTKLKEEAHALQELGAEIIELPAERLKKLSPLLPERLMDAVVIARKVTAHGGRRRQMLFVGKIVRELSDEEVLAIRQAIASFNQTDAASIAQFHALERWRDRLLESDDTLTEFIQAHTAAASPDTLQRLRALIRNARKEREQPNKPPQNYRELFQLLKDISKHADHTT